jgi:hypothetical protein
MSELIEQDKRVAVAPAGAVTTTEAVSFIQMIERASRDPAVDIDKMERLMQMHERMVERKAESDFNDAMTACQKEMGAITADATNPQTKSKYASYAKLDRILRPIYTKHGISISYGTEDTSKAESVRVIAHVARAGYTRKYQVDMPADGKGAKGGDVMTKTHATGAAIAYGSRYLLKAIFNIAVGDEDKDGNESGHKMLAEGIKEDFLKLIPMCETLGQLEQTWADITQATSKAGDVTAHEALRAEVLARRREIQAKAKAAA